MPHFGNPRKSKNSHLIVDKSAKIFHNLLAMKAASKKTNLQKFAKDFKKLLAKYPTVTVFGDMNGNPCACEYNNSRSEHVKIPSQHS